MKTKDLFKKIAAANFVAYATGGKCCYITAETLIDALGYVIELGITNVRDNSARFTTWHEFAASIAADYSEEVCKLIAKGELSVTTSPNCFIIYNPEISEEKIRIFIYQY